MTTLHELEKSPNLRKMAFEQSSPIAVDDTQFSGTQFYLVPQSMWNKLYEAYEDMKDVDEVRKSIESAETSFRNWKDIKKEICTK
jgi:hypothetical protein